MIPALTPRSREFLHIFLVLQVLMVQDIGDLHRTLKVVVELTFRTTKIKTFGWNKTYRVEMWEGSLLGW
ncbi:MAG: hypothetical protein ACOYB2_19555 [Limnohabitans sp.]